MLLALSGLEALLLRIGEIERLLDFRVHDGSNAFELDLNFLDSLELVRSQNALDLFIKGLLHGSHAFAGALGVAAIAGGFHGGSHLFLHLLAESLELGLLFGRDVEVLLDVGSVDEAHQAAAAHSLHATAGAALTLALALTLTATLATRGLSEDERSDADEAHQGHQSESQFFHGFLRYWISKRFGAPFGLSSLDSRKDEPGSVLFTSLLKNVSQFLRREGI